MQNLIDPIQFCADCVARGSTSTTNEILEAIKDDRFKQEVDPIDSEKNPDGTFFTLTIFAK